LRRHPQEQVNGGRPVLEVLFGLGGEGRIRVNAAAAKEQQRAALFQLADSSPGGSHAVVRLVRQEDQVLAGVRQVFQVFDVA